MPADNDAKYRAELAAYHASLRENFLSFLWSRPAHESFTAERNGFAELEQPSINVFDLKVPRSEKRNGRVFDSLDILASPALSAVSRPTASSVASSASINVMTIPTSPIIEKSVNVINPLTGRRIGSDTRLPTPPGREYIRQQAKERLQRRRQGLPDWDIVEEIPRVALCTQSLSATPMQKSRSDKRIAQQIRPDLRSCPEISIFSDQPIPPRKVRNALSYPVRPVAFRRTTSSSTFGERGRTSTRQQHHTITSPSPSCPTTLCKLSRLHIRPPEKESRQASYAGTRQRDRTSRYSCGRSNAPSVEEWSDNESETSSISGRSSHSPLAVTFPVVRQASTTRAVITGNPSSEGPTILIRRHADESHYPPVISPTHHPSPPIYEVIAKHRLPMERRNSGTTLTDMTPRTEFSEASFVALAPSPLFATEIHSAPSLSPLDGSSGMEDTNDAKGHYERDSACPPPKQSAPIVEAFKR
ncbi:hypothetical protein QFC22_000040 [Naganishia vaughanmartiniae]|uniref:Uncharacterized protein n=1 Tax=Naganishia vaughanmartiniae TaxID=1424756 RepID=A0ACC2XQV8_9TREE|nr:hypothetical protein QFC22_000040 [Naganishia vaughanmartiniae]